ncbi:helix-turn-helix domain-containing protein [Streptomyces capparidis]
MLVEEFGSETVAAPERFDRWEAFRSASTIKVELSSDDRDDFCGRLRLLSLGDVKITGLANPHLKVVRGSRLIRQADPEVYHVHVLLSGSGRHEQGGRCSQFRAGQLIVVDSSHPSVGELHTTAGDWSSIIAELPHALLPLPDKAVRRLLGVAFPADDGMARMLRGWLTDLHSRAHELAPTAAPTLASVTADLVTTTLARRLDAEDGVSAEAARRTLWLRVHTFVDQHLGDPGLTPEAIATAHGISTRHLHRLFAEHDRTVAAWIHHRRLERCRHDLADPQLAARPIHAIAAHWGFTAPAHFSRAFRAAYGVSPREHRNAAQAGDAGDRMGGDPRGRVGAAR